MSGARKRSRLPVPVGVALIGLAGVLGQPILVEFYKQTVGRAKTQGSMEKHSDDSHGEFRLSKIKLLDEGSVRYTRTSSGATEAQFTDLISRGSIEYVVGKPNELVLAFALKCSGYRVASGGMDLTAAVSLTDDSGKLRSNLVQSTATYLSADDWEGRTILRSVGKEKALKFLNLQEGEVPFYFIVGGFNQSLISKFTRVEVQVTDGMSPLEGHISTAVCPISLKVSAKGGGQ